MTRDIDVLMGLAVRMKDKVKNLDLRLSAGIRCMTLSELNPAPSRSHSDFTWSNFFTRVAKGLRGLAGESIKLPKPLTHAEIMEETERLTADKLRHVLLSIIKEENLTNEKLGLTPEELEALNKAPNHPQSYFQMGNHIACP